MPFCRFACSSSAALLSAGFSPVASRRQQPRVVGRSRRGVASTDSAVPGDGVPCATWRTMLARYCSMLSWRDAVGAFAFRDYGDLTSPRTATARHGGRRGPGSHEGHEVADAAQRAEAHHGGNCGPSRPGSRGARSRRELRRRVDAGPLSTPSDAGPTPTTRRSSARASARGSCSTRHDASWRHVIQLPTRRRR